MLIRKTYFILMFTSAIICLKIEVSKMKQSKEVVDERREEILQLLQASPDLMLEVNELATKLAVSTMTIRRDLTELEMMGKITRLHGKAQILEKPHFEGNTNNQHIERIKQKIAKQASTYIEDNMTVFINSSSTALMTLHYLSDKSLVVVTNNAHVIGVKNNANTSVILTGGEVRFPKEALVGDLALASLMNFQADVLVLGCSGISPDRGISTVNIHESAINALFIQNTNKKVIVVADYRKIGTDANFFVAPIDVIDILITDTYANPSIIEQFENKGIQVIQLPI